MKTIERKRLERHLRARLAHGAAEGGSGGGDGGGGGSGGGGGDPTPRLAMTAKERERERELERLRVMKEVRARHMLKTGPTQSLLQHSALEDWS